jgi:HEPN domain-containing protein
MLKQKSIPKTHSLEDLLEVCVVLDQSFKMLVHNIMVLDPYAANARYPNDRFSIDHVEAMQAINHATSCFAFVIEKMKT